ncbi:hypothetical protein KP509_03G014400 [Ceratopteris richardii]|nr:hypothetical protein KP509_03G014400 [Ceratopteris richardii]
MDILTTFALLFICGSVLLLLALISLIIGPFLDLDDDHKPFIPHLRIWREINFRKDAQLLCSFFPYPGYIETFKFEFAIYQGMQTSSVNSNNVKFLSMLKACANRGALEEGKGVHIELTKSGCETDLRISSALLRMYSKCSRLNEARHVFDSLPSPDVVMWGAMITGYSQNGLAASALDMFSLLEVHKVKPDATCFSSTLNACGRLGTLQQGKLVHAEVLERGLEQTLVIGGTLVDMYVHCRSLEDAKNVFENCPSRDIVSYGAMISGYVQNGQSMLALQAYAELEGHGIKPNKFLFSCILKACGSIGALSEGAYIHDQAIKAALETDVVVGSAILDMYAKCLWIKEAYSVFKKLHKKDLVAWGAITVGLIQCGQSYTAFTLFKEMLQGDLKPDTYVFTGILKACGITGALNEGMNIHAQVIEAGYELDLCVGNALVDMYAKCRNINDAIWSFWKLPSRNIEAWGAIIAGCTLVGYAYEAISLFRMMLQEYIKLDVLIFSVVFRACGSIGAEAEGRLLHDLAIDNCIASEARIRNALVDMYCRCGRLEDARNEFDKLDSPDASSWGTMVAGYCGSNEWLSALELFESMQASGHKPTKNTLMSLLKACVSVGAVKQGTIVHGLIIRNSYESDRLLGSSLLDMYAGCGCLDEAQKVFDTLSELDVVSWGALMSGYALHGDYQMVGECFNGLCLQGIKPNDFIFTNLLTACSHTGMLDAAGFYLSAMVNKFKMLPNVEQYSCMIDLFGQIGCLKEADDMLQTMAAIPDFVMCTSLLNNCQRHGNLGLGNLCFNKLIRLAPDDASAYVAMLNMYADLEAWDVEELHLCDYLPT